MKSIFTFSERCAGIQSNLFEIRDFPVYAIEAMVDWLNSPKLILLAWLESNTSSNDILPLLKDAMNELGIGELTLLDSSKLLIWAYIRNINLGYIDPFDWMINIDYLYNQIQDLLPYSQYLGWNLWLEHIYTWYREIQDWEDNDDTNFYFTELPRDEQRNKFLSELVREIQEFILKNPHFPWIIWA